MTVGNHNFKRLVEHLRPLSVANETGDLLAEWQPLASYQSETADRCPCGHHPIYEICHIRNRLNGEHTFVGNVCVRHFSTVRVDLIAANQKRIPTGS